MWLSVKKRRVVTRGACLPLMSPVRPEEVGPEALTILEKKFGRPPGGWNNQSFLVALARLGGFLARKSDGSPGWITLWRGWRKLMLLAQGYDLAKGGRKCG